MARLYWTCLRPWKVDVGGRLRFEDCQLMCLAASQEAVWVSYGFN